MIRHHLGLRSRQSPGHDRVCVPLYEDDIGTLLHQDLLYACHYPARLLGVASRAHVQVVLRLGKVQLLEEYPVHLVGVDVVVKASPPALPDHGGHFDYLWTSAEDDCDGHGWFCLLVLVDTILIVVHRLHLCG
jgi:hypothetical protein